MHKYFVGYFDSSSIRIIKTTESLEQAREEAKGWMQNNIKRYIVGELLYEYSKKTTVEVIEDEVK